MCTAFQNAANVVINFCKRADYQNPKSGICTAINSTNGKKLNLLGTWMMGNVMKNFEL